MSLSLACWILNLVAKIGSLTSGAVSLYLLSRMGGMLNDDFNRIMRYVALGVLFLSISIGWESLRENVPLIASLRYGVHDLLTALGMVCLLVAVYRLSKLLLPARSDSREA